MAEFRGQTSSSTCLMPPLSTYHPSDRRATSTNLYTYLDCSTHYFGINPPVLQNHILHLPRDMSGFRSSEAEMALLGEEEEAQRLFHQAMIEEQEQARRIYHQGKPTSDF